MNKKDNLLRSLIRESILQESTMNLVPHAEVVAAIDNAIRPERLSVSIPYFRELMIETATVESGNMDGGKLYHNNEMQGDVKGVFQLSSIALSQLRKTSVAKITKGKLEASGAMQKKWSEQTDAEIFGSLKMQAIAACMYMMWAYYNLAGEPSLASTSDRANFWETYYNTSADEKGTVAYFTDKLKELSMRA